MKRLNESPEVSHLLDTFYCPECSQPSLEIIDRQYGQCHNEDCGFEGTVKTRAPKPHEDQTKCVIINNQLYCIEKDLLDVPLKKVKK